MLRSILTATAILLLTGASASAQPAETGASSGASVRLAQCLRGADPGDRIAVFRGTMRRVAGSERMWMRFKLQERVGAGRFRTIGAPGFGVWHKSRPGVRRLAYRHRIEALAKGSAYRTIVSFRWYSADGKLVRRARRRSAACKQPGLLPNLRLTRVGGGSPLAGVPGAYRYAVHVANRGPVATGRFGVSLAVDGGTLDTLTVTGLAPGESRRLIFSGPACKSGVRAVADPDDTVRELSERDNSFTAPCPLRL